MKGKIYLTVIIVLLSSLSIFAQTPTVTTLKASGVSSTEIPEGSSNISISAALKGAVNANGTNCTVSFEYGNTTSYGNTIAASPGTVTGSVDNAINAAVTLYYTHTGPQERLIHYRVKVTNEYGTYYGRDFIATAIDPTRNIFISATCTDGETWAFFDVMNNNSFEITVNYSAGASYTGSVIIGTNQVQQVFVGKGSICSFYYHYTLFKQVFTNDQPCSETQLPKQKIFMTATGKIASDKMMYRIENSNSSSVNIEITCGSSNYTYTIAPQSVAYFAGTLAEAQIGISGDPEAFAISSPSGGYAYEGMAWLSVTPLSTTATTANFELYNRDDATHTFVMRNAGGTENSYTLAAYESRTVTLSNENWDVYTTVWDPTGMRYGILYDNIYTGPAFGDATSFYNGLLKVATAIPGSSITASVTPATIASSTSLTLNGVISNNAFANTDVDYHFIYGTDPNNLNQSTSTQSGTVQAFVSLNVNATVTGLTEGTLYYYKLVAGGITSASGKMFLSSSIPSSNLKLWLRSDLAVTSASSAVSTWGDVSGLGNDASQNTSANQPTLVSNSINGNPVIRFNGTTSKMSLPTSVTLGIQNNPYEMFIVARSSYTANPEFLISGGATEQFEYHLNGARFIPIPGSSNYLDIGLTGAYTDGNAHVFSARASSSGGAVRVDGIDGGTSSANILSSNSGALLLGVRSDGTYYFNGDLAEVILYNTNLSTSDRSTVEHYLANRYGITSGALPVELTSFTANVFDGKVLLNWQTATEVNNYGFNVEWTSPSPSPYQGEGVPIDRDGRGWETLGFVQGHGNSNSPKSYSFTDNLANTLAHNLVLDRISYRLKQIDFDGKYEYSNVVEVKIDAPAQFALEQNYPNPFNPETTISYQLPTSGHVTLKVFDMLGREVATLVNEFKSPGVHHSKFNALSSSFSSGVYFYQLKAGAFVQAKKFILTK
ncbi:MAG: T9SS type A sorting domain-containing protein [Melioribacteraceae bacterium]